MKHLLFSHIPLLFMILLIVSIAFGETSPYDMNNEKNSSSDLEAFAPLDREVAEIGSRRELFIDNFLIDGMIGTASRRMHHPTPREVVHALDKPWEGNTSAYLAVFEDNDRIVLTYNATPRRRQQTTAIIESRDGINFTRPVLNIYNFEGSTQNNLLSRRGAAGHNFTMFKDPNPAAPAEERYKAISYFPGAAGIPGGGGLGAWISPDGLDWELVEEERIIERYHPDTGELQGGFDSQNLAFWDPKREIYVCYYRGPTPGEEDRYGRVARGIWRSESEDFRQWSSPEPIEYRDSRVEHMYTNGIRPYFRAPHIYIGTPNRFVTRRRKVAEHPGPGINDVLLMSSRDGKIFDRWASAFIRPGPEPEVWTERNNYPAWGMIQTSPEEISLYWTEHYRHPVMRIRRGTIRIDGFVSLHADAEGGEMLTRPLTFSGDRLLVNYQTSAVGDIQFELTDRQGEPIPGFSFDDSETLFGNAIEHMVAWDGNTNLDALKGEEVRLRIRLQDADLYSIRFDTDENIRVRLEDRIAEAKRMMEETQKHFAGRRREELINRKNSLTKLLAGEDDPAQNWLSTDVLLQRAKHQYRDVMRAETQALAAISAAEDVLGQEVGFGRLYQGTVKALHERLKIAMDDKSVSAEHLNELTGRLSGAVDNFRETEDTRQSTGESLEDGDEILAEPAEGFGRLFQERIQRRLEALRDLLADEGATIGEMKEAKEYLEKALTSYKEVGVFSPVQKRVVSGTSAALSISSPSDWEAGLLVNAGVENDKLIWDGDVSLWFGGEEAYAECAAGEALKPDVVTLEAWVKLQDKYLSWHPWITLGKPFEQVRSVRRPDWTQHAYNIWAHRARPEFTLGSREAGAQVRTGRDPTVESGEWQHVAGQFDGKQARLFINGALAKTTGYEGEIDYRWSDALRIGGKIGHYFWFEGQIRDVRVWNTVRTEQEIQDNMHAELSGEEPNLAGLWIAGRHAGEGNKFFDMSSSNHHGTIFGAEWRLPGGYHLSGPIQFTDIPQVARSVIEWETDGEIGVPGTSIEVLVGMSDSDDALPREWTKAVSGDTIPFVEKDTDLSTHRLWIKTKLSPKEPGNFVRVSQITIGIESKP